MGPSIAFLILSFILLFQNVHAEGEEEKKKPPNGVIGFGISLYQDLCCQACHDSLSALYLSCTTFEDGGEMEGMDMGGEEEGPVGETSEECMASNLPWLQTMAFCIAQKCGEVGYPIDKQAECFSAQALGGATKPTYAQSLPPLPPTEMLTDDAEWLNTTSLVNDDIYYSTYGTLGEFARQEYIHTRLSLVLYLLVVGIIIIYGLWAQVSARALGFQRKFQFSGLLSKLRAGLFLPALFGGRRLQPLPGNLGYIPGRMLSLAIFIYIVINVVFSAVQIRLSKYQPNMWFMSPGFELCEYVGNRTGTLSMVNMGLAILFAGRNNLLIMLTGWSQTTFLTLHRWIARVAAVQAVVHSIVYTMAYWQEGYGGAEEYAEKVKEPFYWWGIIATVALCLAAGFAFLPFRIRFYEIFLLFHIIFVILALVGTWYHIIIHFSYDFGYQTWLYLCFVFWAADRLARVGRILYYNGSGVSKAYVEAIPGTDIMQLTVFPRGHWTFGPGEHSFLYFPGLVKFWESHPFSCAGWHLPGQHDPSMSTQVTHLNGESSGKETYVLSSQSYEEPYLRFMVRAHSGITGRLRRRLEHSPPGSQLEVSVLTEGPYSGHRATNGPLYTADTILMIAGGIGVTHILGFVQEYASTRRLRLNGGPHGHSRKIMPAKRFVFAWVAKELPLIEYVKRNYLQDIDGVEFMFYCDGLNQHIEKFESHEHEHDEEANGFSGGKHAEVNMSFMNIGSVLRNVVEPGLQTTVMVCAPGVMSDEVTRQVVNCIKEGHKVDLVEETFAW